MKYCLSFFVLLSTHLDCTANFLIRCDSLPDDSLSIADSLLLQSFTTMNKELEDIHETLQELEESNNQTLEKKKSIHFGLSLGYRWLTSASSHDYIAASVSPLDSTLRITPLDRTSYLFSTSVIFDLNLGKYRKGEREKVVLERKSQRKSARSFKASGKRRSVAQRLHGRSAFGYFLYNSVDRLCIVTNLNILDFSNGQKELAFNKSIEGGLGIGYKLNESIYLGLNWEHMQTLVIYDDIRAMEGQKLVINGEDLVSSEQLETDNPDVYYRKNLSGWGLKMIISL